MSDPVALIKKTGVKIEGVAAWFTLEGNVIVHGTKVPLEEGDILERPLPGGVLERWIVLESRFTQGFVGHEAGSYVAKVRKASAIAAEPSSVSYTLIGDHARVNVNSQDSSINLSHVSAASLFSDLRKSVQEGVGNQELMNVLLAKIDELEAARGSRGFLEKYQQFMSLAKDHMTLLAPFIPALTNMLG